MKLKYLLLLSLFFIPFISFGADLCNSDVTNINCWSTTTIQQWSTEYYIDTSADSLTDGLANTNALYNLEDSYFPSAEYCVDLEENGYDNWYLPANDELLTAYQTLGTEFFDTDLWSSTEYDIADAWFLSYISGEMDYLDKGTLIAMRCLREEVIEEEPPVATTTIDLSETNEIISFGFGIIIYLLSISFFSFIFGSVNNKRIK